MDMTCDVLRTYQKNTRDWSMTFVKLEPVF